MCPCLGTLVKAEDKFVVVKGLIGGVEKEKLIFKADIVSMKTLGGAPEAAVAKEPTEIGTADAESVDVEQVKKAPNEGAAAGNSAGKRMGVFMLPMSGMVGEGFRSNEIEAIAREADKLGPGQIIVLRINSGGGLGIEMERIHFTIAEIKKRHRVVAWIEEAISAAAATASNCDEIYFMTDGTLGAMTGFAGGVALQGEELRKWLDSGGRWMQSGGRSPCIAWAMIDDTVCLSYDKDPTTGEVTWHCDLSGEFVLSDQKTNLTFTSSNAVHSGFADGIADTEEDLAQLLNLPKWVELGNGRKIAETWLKTVDQAKYEIPLLVERLDYKSTGLLDDQARLGTQIQIFNKLLNWWDRAPNVCFLSGVPPKDELERILAEMKKSMSDMKRARRQ